jgi:hypothetical protein
VRTVRSRPAVLAAGLALAGTAHAAQDCDRVCLIGVSDAYLAPLTAHDPAKTQAVVISELFKIEAGKIRRIEAVMTGNLDLDTPSGWGE